MIISLSAFFKQFFMFIFIYMLFLADGQRVKPGRVLK